MKTFEELTDKEKEKAINHYTNELLTVIVQGGVRFNDELNEDALQASEGETMKTTKCAILLFALVILLAILACGAIPPPVGSGTCTFTQSCCRSDGSSRICIQQTGQGFDCPFCPVGYLQSGDCQVTCE